MTLSVILAFFLGAFHLPSQIFKGFALLICFGCATIYLSLLILRRKPKLILCREGLVFEGIWRSMEIKWTACGPFSLGANYYGLPITKFSIWALSRDNFNFGDVDGSTALGPDFRVPISIFGFNREAKAAEFVAKVNALRLASLEANIKQDNPSTLSVEDYAKRKYRRGYLFLVILFGCPLAITAMDLLLDYLDRLLE